MGDAAADLDALTDPATMDGSAASGYDPFVRGRFPVGVGSGLLVDRSRADRELPFELWYPATARDSGLDLDPATQDAFAVLPDGPDRRPAAVRAAAVQPGRYPLVLF